MSISFAFECLLFLLLGGVSIMYHFRKRRVRKLLNQFSGPVSLPILGNVHRLIGSSPILLQRMKNELHHYTSPMRGWVFNQPFVLMWDPENFRELGLLSNKVVKKGKLHHFFDSVFGSSLLTVDVYETWKKKRLLLPAAFNLKYTGSTYLQIFHRMEHNLIQDLDRLADTNQPFDLFEFVSKNDHRTSFNVMTGFDAEHIEMKYKFNITKLMGSVHRGISLATARIHSPWFYPNVIYSIYNKLIGGNPVLESFREVLQMVLRDRHELLKNDIHSKDQDPEEKRKRILIDVLLDADLHLYDERDRVDELLSFLETGSGPISVTVCFTLLMLAMHPQHQDRVYNEIMDILGDRENEIDVQEFNKLTFLEQCIKETLRLFPPTPFIIQSIKEDILLKDGRIIPSDTTIVAAIFFLHRNKLMYPNPEVWDPSRFHPEEINKRHAYSFMPFSVAPRNCIGYKYAYLAIKSQVAALLREFRFTTEMQISDIKLAFEPVLGNLTDYRVRLYRRK